MSSRQWTWESALTGVVPPLISPLTEAGEPDDAAMARLVGHILSGGGTGLFVLGGCGEGAWLTLAQRGAVVRAAVQAAGGRAPVLAGVMLPATGPASEAARQAADEGADALVVGSPYYFAVDSATQRRHVEALLGAVDLPVLLYNIPQSTNHRLSPELVGDLASIPRVLGIKDSAGDFRALQQFLAIKRGRPDFRVLQGDESLCAASLLHGGDGLVPGMANFAPELFVALVAAVRRDDVRTARQLQEQINDLGTLHVQAHWLSALKGACALRGLGNGRPAPPLVPLTEEQRSRVAEIVQRHVTLPVLAGAGR